MGLLDYSNYSVVVMIIVVIRVCMNSEVNVMEDFMRMSSLADSWNSVDFLLDILDSLWRLSDEWDFIGDCVLFNFIGGQFLGVFYLVWNHNLSSVWFLVLDNIWFINNNLEWDFFPISLWEGFLDSIWLFFVLSDWDLGRNNVWSLLDHGVIDSDSALIWDRDLLFIRNLVINSVWDPFGNYVRNLVNDFVWHFSGGDIWDSLLNLEWHLSFNGVWDICGNFNWHKSLNLVFLSNIISLGNLVWDLLDCNNWDLFSNLVFLSHVLGNSVDVFIIR